MAYRLTALSAPPRFQGGARWSKLLLQKPQNRPGKQGRTMRNPSAAKNGGNALLHCLLKLEQNWSKTGAKWSSKGAVAPLSGLGPYRPQSLERSGAGPRSVCWSGAMSSGKSIIRFAGPPLGLREASR